MNQTPRYFANQRSDAQNNAKSSAGIDETEPTALQPQVAGPQPQQPKIASTTAAPTAETTADEQRRQHYRGVLHRHFDQLIRDELLRLAMLPGNVSGRGYESSSRSSDRSIPVDAYGNARGDVTLAKLQSRALKANSIRAKRELLDEIRDEIQSVSVARRAGWADRGTLEGRLMIARHARQHGRADAAYAYAISTRTVTKYLAELRAHEGRNR